MAKFKIGDRVRICKCEPLCLYPLSWDDENEKYLGEFATVEKIINDNQYYLKGIDFCWHEHWLELTDIDKEKRRLLELAKAVELLKDECSRYSDCTKCPLALTDICIESVPKDDWDYPDDLFEVAENLDFSLGESETITMCKYFHDKKK